MVYLNSTSMSAVSERLRRSADLAIRDLLDHDKGYFDLANYFWIIDRLKSNIVNGDALTSWAENLVQEVLVSRVVGRRIDESVAAASLCFVVLMNRGYKEPLSEIGTALDEFVGEQIMKGAVPFNSIAYGSSVLLARLRIGESSDPLVQSLNSMLNLVDVVSPPNRLIGLNLFSTLLCELKLKNQSERLLNRIGAWTSGPPISQEAQAYIADSKLILRQCVRPDLSIAEIEEIGQVALDSPYVSFLGIADEDVEPGVNTYSKNEMSHLYRVALLGISGTTDPIIRRHSNAQAESILKSNPLTTRLASIGAFTVFLLIFVLITKIVRSTWSEGTSYFLDNNYKILSDKDAILFLFLCWFWLFFTIFGIVAVWKIFLSMLIRNHGNDQQLVRALSSSFRLGFSASLGVFMAIVGLWAAESSRHLFNSIFR